MQINQRQEQLQEAAEARAAAGGGLARKLEEAAGLASPPPRVRTSGDGQTRAIPGEPDEDRFDLGEMEGMTMADLLGAPDRVRKQPREERNLPRSVDDFDFDEEAFLAALGERTGGHPVEVISGKVIEIESDGVCIDIGGKYRPPGEAGLGVIAISGSAFPRGWKLRSGHPRTERRRNGHDRARWLRKNWGVKEMEKQGKVIQVINGFSAVASPAISRSARIRPRSQLQDGENHRSWLAKPSAWPSWR